MKYDLVLFAVLAALAFLPLFQQLTGSFKVKPLFGSETTMDEGNGKDEACPEFSNVAFLSGNYQKQCEAYASHHFGFRECVIRLYNRYLWDCYKKTYAHEVVAGKHGWLFFNQNVDDYYGTEMYHWQATAEEARAVYDREVRLMRKLREVMHDYDIEFFVFMAPEKGFVYPEYLPQRDFDTMSVNAREYYAQELDKIGFPFIEMTEWFQAMRDTVPFPLFPPTGAHWNFSSVYAADSLVRFMEAMKSVELPHLRIGPLYPSPKYSLEVDYDLAHLLNVAGELNANKRFKLMMADVEVVASPQACKPDVLFVGNSFMWRIHSFIDLNALFNTTEFWYYNVTAYSGDSLNIQRNVLEIDHLEKFLGCDYIVWFTTGNQMYKASYGFVEKALMTMCLSQERVNEVRRGIMDSLMMVDACKADVDDSTSFARYWEEATRMLIDDPERWFPELSGDETPTCRNPRIPIALAIIDIKRDAAWMEKLSYQTVIQNAKMDQVLEMEADNVLNGRPLLRDMENIEAKRDRVEQLVADMVKDLQSKPDMMQQIEEKAAKNGLTVEEQTVLDARWIVNRLIEKHYYSLETP